ncbi:unnamed protein product [Arabis nemorensis]|uniref:RING-type domain-containing protein n=1 Tax=Arabis nemorensis TaxID=586526 RepID=A0A565AY36_9BRAS|nr:unnamed protein product [Arabis nemorensis]
MLRTSRSDGWKSCSNAFNRQIGIVKNFTAIIYRENLSLILKTDNSELGYCFVCLSNTNSLDRGCGHLMCSKCFADYCSSRVRGGDLQGHCSYLKCAKLYSFEAVKSGIDENLTFELDMATIRHYVSSKPDITWCSGLLCCLFKHRN